MTIRIAQLLSALILAMALSPGEAAALQVLSQAQAPGGVQRFTVRPDHLDRDFVIDVSAPSSPAAGDKLPAVYALDGGYGVVIPEGGLLGRQGGMQPAILVTVGYAADAAALRLIDLLYQPATVNGKATGGGGAAFQDFLLKELRPFIEGRYPADPAHATLFGHSVGGLFAANLLAREPQAFENYLIASPSVWADPGVIDRLTALPPGGAGQRVFVAVGGAEDPGMQAGAAAVAAALQGKFQVQGRGYENGTHLGYYPLLVATALPWLLPPK